jgi:D-alanyl-D-alanine dipeptidase
VRAENAAMNRAGLAAFACALLLVACGAAPSRYSVPPLPVSKVEQLRSEALKASPPVEQGPFRDDDLVEPVLIDPTLKLDVRYATSDNILRTPVYPEARLFLQRPAAEALVQANQALRAQGYGLVLFDGYRPWYVTKLFWLATPTERRQFVADPDVGSRHNRGSSIDVTLYRLATGAAVEMPSGYDEFSERAHPDYAGGSTEARAARDRLRRTMEAAGFSVHASEWWHYDHRDWEHYRLNNAFFKDLP